MVFDPLSSQLSHLHREGEEREAQRRAAELQLSYVNLSGTPINPEALKYISLTESQEAGALPLEENTFIVKEKNGRRNDAPPSFNFLILIFRVRQLIPKLLNIFPLLNPKRPARFLLKRNTQRLRLVFLIRVRELLRLFLSDFDKRGLL